MREKFSLHKFIRKTYGSRITTDMIMLIGLVFLMSLLQFLLVFYSGQVIDITESGASFESVARTVILMAAFLVGSTILSISIIHAGGRLKINFLRKLHNNLVHKLCHADFAPLESISDDELLSRVNNDTDEISSWLDNVYQFGHIPVKLGLVMVFSFISSWQMIVVELTVLPIFMVITALLSRKLENYNRIERETLAESIGHINTSMHIRQTIKAFCLESIFIKKNYDLLNENRNARLKIQKRIHSIDIFSTSLGNVFMAALLGIGAFFILDGQISIGTLFVLIFFIDMLGDGARIIFSAIPTYHKAVVCAQRVNELLTLDLEKNNLEWLPSRADSTDTVFDMQSVSFSYGNKDVFDNLSFTIQKGETIAIVGQSGSGKTTLFKLLCGLYKPKTGKIYINGQDMDRIPIGAIRDQMSVATQESFLFHDTFNNNIRISSPDASD